MIRSLRYDKLVKNNADMNYRCSITFVTEYYPMPIHMHCKIVMFIIVAHDGVFTEEFAD